MNLRRSCFNCVFRTVERVSDLTLGDFWGCENIWKDWMENKGYSLIFVQNEKGKSSGTVFKMELSVERWIWRKYWLIIKAC